MPLGKVNFETRVFFSQIRESQWLTSWLCFQSLTKSSQDDKTGGYFQEEFEIDLENEKYEKINVPDFRDGRRGRFIHDFYSVCMLVKL